jgi:hypothetical protein
MKKIVLLCLTAICIAAIPSISLAQYSDVKAPTLVGLTLDPLTIDTSYEDQTVAITGEFTDDLSGFYYANVYLSSPTGNQTQYGYLYYWNVIEGDSLHGKFQGSVTIPKSAEAGTWKISRVYLRDQAGNYVDLDAAQLEALGISSSLEVVSVPDTEAPTLTSLSISPAVVDVSSGSQKLTVTMAIKDNMSGLDLSYPGNRYSYTFLAAQSPSGQYLSAMYDGVRLISGTVQDGVFEIDLTIPQYAESGQWRIYYLYLADRVGNIKYLYFYNWPATINNTFAVISSPSDVKAPVLTSLNFSPTFINTSEGAQSVDVSFGLKDDLSGIRSTTYQGNHVTWYWTIAWIYFQSPSGGQTVYASIYFPDQMKSGTPLNSVWQTQMNFPRYSEAGTWKATYVYLYDAARNSRYMGLNDLIAAGLPTEITVIKPSLGIDGTIDGAAGGVIQDEVFGNRAGITAPAGVLGSGSIDVAIDVLSVPPDIPTPQGFGAAGSRYVNLNLTPKPSYPLPSPGLTLTIPLIEDNPPAPGTPLNLFRINSATGALVPAFGADGFPIVGFVNADGVSATFTGIISFSTVVALTRTTEIPGDLNGDQKVNCDDVKIVKASFGKRQGQNGYDWRADINRNKVVDVNDLAFVSKLLPAGTKCK